MFGLFLNNDIHFFFVLFVSFVVKWVYVIRATALILLALILWPPPAISRMQHRRNRD